MLFCNSLITYDYCLSLYVISVISSGIDGILKRLNLQGGVSLMIDWLIKVSHPTKHIIGHIKDGFYGSNDPTNSVKALKEGPKD